MNSIHGWLLDSLKGAYTLESITGYVEELSNRFDLFMERLSEDDRNYLLEAITAMKDKIITSEIENIISLVDKDDIATGSKFVLRGDGLRIVSDNFEDSTSPNNLGSIKSDMEKDFFKREDILSSAITKGSLGESNTVSIDELPLLTDAVKKTATSLSATRAEVDSVEASNPMSIVNVGFFKDRYILSRLSGQEEAISLSIAASLSIAKIQSSNVEYVEQDITDGELRGSGSKISDFVVDRAASTGQTYQDDIYVIINYEDTYTININGTDYSYAAQDVDTAEDIAGGLESELSNNSDITVSTDIGYWSKVFQNDNGDKIFGWYALIADDSRTFAVKFVVPSDSHDLTIELGTDNPDQIIITYEHDGFDVVYPTIGDIRDLVNNFADSPIRVVVMPGFSEDDEYNTADEFDLEIGASKITIEASSQLDLKIDTTSEPYKFEYLHIRDYAEPSVFSGHFEVVKFNPSDTYYIDIDKTHITVVPSQDQEAKDEQSLARVFTQKINSASLGLTAARTAATVTITADTGGKSYTITTSGEHNYQVPIPRSTILRYDLRNMPMCNSLIEVDLKKPGTAITHTREPLSKADVANIVNSGTLFSKKYLMFPVAPATYDSSNNFVPPIKKVAALANLHANKNNNEISTAHLRIAPVIRSYPTINGRLNTTEAALSNRWFFVEAGADSLAPASSLGIALDTISPEDYERLVLQDDTMVFSTARNSRLKIQSGIFESISSLLTEKIHNYNAGGLSASISISSKIISTEQFDIIKRNMTEKQIDGFIKYALLPNIKQVVTPPNEKQEDIILTNEADELYRALMEYAIQVNDDLREQRFIALAGSYIIDSSKLTDYFGDDDYRSFVFGVDEPETPPENNYGLGGSPIDQTVTMSSLYFRNMRSLAMPIENKSAPNPLSPDIENIYRMVAPNGILRISGAQNTTLFDIRVANNETSIPEETKLEDALYREIARTGFFTSKIDVGLNHSAHGYSKLFKDSIWALLMSGLEIRDDETIASINNARSLLQVYYSSFEKKPTVDEFALMLASPSRIYANEPISYKNANEADFTFNIKRVNQYSAITTLFLKILLFFREKKDSIQYKDWQDKFNGIVGRVFMDDELETDILSFDLFNVFVCESGAYKAFSFSTDIYNAAKAYTSGLDMSKIIQASGVDDTYTATWQEDNTTGRCGLVISKG